MYLLCLLNKVEEYDYREREREKEMNKYRNKNFEIKPSSLSDYVDFDDFGFIVFVCVEVNLNVTFDV